MNNNTIQLNRYLDDVKDKCFVYSIMCYKAENFYNRIKLMLKLPVILTSACMSIINSNFEDVQTLKIVNISFNITTAVILAVSSSLQLEAKEQEFLNAKKKFIKLESEIECKMLSNEVINNDYINSVIERYNSIEENLDFPIPSFILRSTREKYKEIKSLPFIINGIPKKEEYRPTSLHPSPVTSIVPDPKLSSIPENNSIC